MNETVSRPAVLFMADEFDENAKVSRADNKLFSAQEWGYLAARLRALPATDTAECERLRTHIELLEITNTSLHEHIERLGGFAKVPPKKPTPQEKPEP